MTGCSRPGLPTPSDFVAPRPATDEDILLVHTPQYVEKLKTGTLSAREELELEVPYSPELVRAFWLAAGGSVLAADHALNDGVAISIGGGFHHAFPDHGEGFCMINDVAIAIRCMQRDEKIRTAMTVDCDVHQGNGTAAIFSGARVAPVQPASASASESVLESCTSRCGGRPPGTVPAALTPTDVFTISLHQQNNYPAFKPPSSLDLNLPDEIGDADYLACLGDALSLGLGKFEPELICYLAGADPYREDQLGGLSLTIEGLKERDALVFQIAKAAGHPGDGHARRRLRPEARRHGHDSQQHGGRRAKKCLAGRADGQSASKLYLTLWTSSLLNLRTVRFITF